MKLQPNSRAAKAGAARSSRELHSRWTRRCIAAAGVAAEHRLFVRGRLLAADGRPLDHPDRADMKLFVDHIVGGSGSRDKRLFFGADRTEADGTWCAADDEEFGGTAIGVSRALDNRAELVGLIAEALFGHRRRDGHALADMARSFSA